jgi:hypothetical protein
LAAVTRGLAILVLLVWLASAGSQRSAGAPATSSYGTVFEFALIGDLGYSVQQDVWFASLLSELNATPELAFIVHDGDLWGDPYGGCHDEFYAARLEWFQASVHPFIFVLGDNDWTDCWQDRFGGFDQMERLALERRLFFSDEFSLGQRKLPLLRQSTDPRFSAYRENVRWDFGNVTFLTLNIQGSNDNRGTGPNGEEVEWTERTAANLAWLRAGFTHAAAAQSRAVMVVIQANPGFELPTERRTGFNDFIVALEEQVVAFGRPVVLVHGDTHYFRIDKPLLSSVSGRRLENFTRVETFGQPDHHWLHVTVDDMDPNVFTFRQRIVEANLVDHTTR